MIKKIGLIDAVRCASSNDEGIIINKDLLLL